MEQGQLRRKTHGHVIQEIHSIRRSSKGHFPSLAALPGLTKVLQLKIETATLALQINKPRPRERQQPANTTIPNHRIMGSPANLVVAQALAAYINKEYPSIRANGEGF
jgi:hypothetical protein